MHTPVGIWVDIESVDWWACGSPVVLLFKGGVERQGELLIDELWTGEDEVPVPEFRPTDGGPPCSVWDADKLKVLIGK